MEFFSGLALGEPATVCDAASVRALFFTGKTTHGKLILSERVDVLQVHQDFGVQQPVRRMLQHKIVAAVLAVAAGFFGQEPE
ncbi:MAG: hypothetical protein ABMA02_02075 [Saprospiraceae bacterium]